MDGELWFLFATVAVIGILAGFVHSAIGFGFGIVAISLLPFVIDARSAHVVVSISSVPMLIMAAWAYREGIEWASLKLALLGAAIFLPLGLCLFATVSLDWLVRGTGLAILATVLASLRNRTSHGDAPSSKGSCFAAGAAAGFLAGAVSIAGPPIAAFALKQDWSQARFKAFVTQFLLVISIYKAGLLAAGSYVVWETAWQTMVVAAFAIAGVQLGVMASRRISAARFKHLVAAALIVVSSLMIWQGQSDAKEESSNQNRSPVAKIDR